MSASNWAVCPRCKIRQAEAEAEILASYGKIPMEEFDRKRAEMAERREQRDFREDYEIYGAGNGIVVVEYCGQCRVCRLSLEFRDEHPIEGAS